MGLREEHAREPSALPQVRGGGRPHPGVKRAVRVTNARRHIAILSEGATRVRARAREGAWCLESLAKRRTDAVKGGITESLVIIKLAN